MKKHLIIMAFGFWLVLDAAAQQVPVTTMFVENPFLYNPAVAGTDNGFKVRMNNRLQWLGFNDAPVTNMLSAYGPHKNRSIGYGGTVGYDVTGPSSRFNLNGAFAYNFALGGKLRLSAGIDIGFIQYRIDGTQLILDSPDDPARQDDPYAPAAMMSAFLPDASAGVWLYNDNLYFGLSAMQLFNSNIRFNGQDSRNNRLTHHYYATVGYRFMFGNWMLEPAVMARYVNVQPLQLAVTARVMYRQQFWLGFNERNTFSASNDLSIMLGYIHSNRLNIGIAYDYGINADIRSATSGTIELVIGYNFDDIKHRKKKEEGGDNGG